MTQITDRDITDYLVNSNSFKDWIQYSKGKTDEFIDQNHNANELVSLYNEFVDYMKSFYKDTNINIPYNSFVDASKVAANEVMKTPMTAFKIKIAQAQDSVDLLINTLNSARQIIINSIIEDPSLQIYDSLFNNIIGYLDIINVNLKKVKNKTKPMYDLEGGGSVDVIKKEPFKTMSILDKFSSKINFDELKLNLKLKTEAALDSLDIIESKLKSPEKKKLIAKNYENLSLILKTIKNLNF
jgi:hypothetical protein